MKSIDWKLLAEAVDFYERAGFIYTEVPWLVSQEATYATLPENISDPYQCSDGYLLGSGEQGFIQSILDCKLDLHNRFTVTPCFRNEPEDDLHRRWFMKLELYSARTTRESLDLMIETASKFMNYQLLDEQVSVEWTGDMQADLTLNGIEVGSYGKRVLPKREFLYGTGLALPRFTQAL